MYNKIKTTTHTISQNFIKIWLRMIVGSYLMLLATARALGPPKKNISDLDSFNILLTGTFYADNWLLSHIRPLANSKECSEIILVTDYPAPPLHKVRIIKPYKWLSLAIGPVPSRLITFFWIGLIKKPKIIGGFHLLFNGLLSALIASCIGSRSMYFCVGGPTETLYGGKSENRLFGKLQQPDPTLTEWLIKAVSSFDQIITMGYRAIQFFQERGVHTIIDVVSGAIDVNKFYPSQKEKEFDLILVARLSPVKCVDLFVRIVHVLQFKFPEISAAIVGDGPLLGDLKALSIELGVHDHISFLGHQKDVENWLRRAKIFVLTSSSEGLALAMMEAMMCALPVVVPHVGDLDTLVKNGLNGFLIEGRSPEEFATPIEDLLVNAPKLESFSREASSSAKRYHPDIVTKLWDDILGKLKIIPKQTSQR